MAPRVSFLVATYQEAARIDELLSALPVAPGDEVLVCDGGSPDGTAERAAAHPGVRVIAGPRCRAEQFNAGARAATGEVLLFLHADVRLPESSARAMREAVQAGAPAGNFDIVYDGADRTAAIFSAINRVRCRCGIFYGDSGIFCTRAVFERLGGFATIPILEDYELARRLWRLGGFRLLREPIHVSDRRWRSEGLLATLWSWFWIQALYCAGVPARRLARLYVDVR